MFDNAGVEALKQLWETIKPDIAEIIKTPFGYIIIGLLIAFGIYLAQKIIKWIIRKIKNKFLQKPKL